MKSLLQFITRLVRLSNRVTRIFVLIFYFSKKPKKNLLEVSFSTNQLFEHSQSDMLALYCDAVRNGLGTQVIANHGLIRRTTGVGTGGTRFLSTALFPIEKKTQIK